MKSRNQWRQKHKGNRKIYWNKILFPWKVNKSKILEKLEKAEWQQKLSLCTGATTMGLRDTKKTTGDTTCVLLSISAVTGQYNHDGLHCTDLPSESPVGQKSKAFSPVLALLYSLQRFWESTQSGCWNNSSLWGNKTEVPTSLLAFSRYPGWASRCHHVLWLRPPFSIFKASTCASEFSCFTPLLPLAHLSGRHSCLPFHFQGLND